MTHTLHLGDCRTVLATLDDNSIDAIVCDPPYELGFMGKAWDNSGIAYDVTVWKQCLRVLKPGGHLIAFGGSRTYHRLAVAIEDAGFEIRDQIQWIYGSGFPKSHNLKDEWQGWGTALKPAHEPAVLARKPLCGTVADNVMTWGVGGLNIDGTRVGTSKRVPGSPSTKEKTGAGFIMPPVSYGSGHDANIGRWPANVILDEDAAKALDMQSGGNVSRFFYTAKASKSEREAGLDGMIKKRDIGSNQRGISLDSHFRTDPRSPNGGYENKPQEPRANHHPTVKPLSLMRYLVRLVTPKGGKVLDPFMGSGSTGCASILEGFDFVGIDITPEYVAIAQKRIDHYAVTSPLEGF
jgi:site-specific DNA-methyltransferase (adenine-specific)